MSEFLIIGIAAPLLLIVLPFSIIALTKKAPDFIKDKPVDIKSFTSNSTLENTKNKILDFARSDGYKWEVRDNLIVLKNSMSILSWGFFYPIYLSKNDSGINVEISIKARLKQQDQTWNPVRNSKWQKVFDGIKKTVAT